MDRFQTATLKLAKVIRLMAEAKEADPYVDDCPSARIDGARDRKRRLDEATTEINEIRDIIKRLYP